jgi:iron complex transport system ATP-binding protein
VLELANATVIKNGVTVLDQLTFRIASGEHTAILGPNGAGKSSLIRLLSMDDYPVANGAGEPPLRLFGHELWNVSELRSRLGIVSPDLHSRFVHGTWAFRVSGLEAVLSGFFSSQAVFEHHVVSDAMRVDALSALKRVGGEYLAGKRLDEMSTGEARRVLIARALITTPEVLVLDEPTTGLDPVARHQFMEHVRRIARSGTTIVLVTHHVEEIIPEIGRVVLLEHGRVAADGLTAEVLTGARIQEVFGAPLTITEVDGYYYMRPRG